MSEAAWTAARAGHGEPGWLTGHAAADAYACDAKIVPIVTGHVNRTALANLTAEWLAARPHLIAIHRWGWTITLHADGTTTATSPDGQRTLHSHGPPTTAAA